MNFFTVPIAAVALLLGGVWIGVEGRPSAPSTLRESRVLAGPLPGLFYYESNEKGEAECLAQFAQETAQFTIAVPGALCALAQGSNTVSPLIPSTETPVTP